MVEVLNKEKVLDHAKQLIDEGKIDKAVIEYRRLLDIDPKDMRIKIRIGELLVKQKKISDAVKIYKEVAENYTDDGFYLKAVTIFKNILRLNPSLMDVNYKLAELYEKMGLARDAIHQYQIISNTLEQKNDNESLVHVRRKMVELDPHNTSNRIRLAETFQYQGKEEDALDEYEQLVKEIKATGKTEQIVEIYEKILSYRPDNLEIMREIVAIYYKRGEWKRILAHLEKNEEIAEKAPDLLVIQADIYGRLNQLETAKNRYRDAALLFIANGEMDKAINAYKEILVINPDVEEEVAEFVGEIDADIFPKIKAEAEAKRKEIEEKRAVSEGDVAEVQGVGSKVPGVARLGQLNEDDVKKKLREAEAAFDLGKAYRQLGLAKEAEPELMKSHDIFKAVEDGGFKSEKTSKSLKQIEEWLHIPQEETLGLDAEPIAKEAVAKIRDNVVEKKKEITDKKDEKPELQPKKKRDKRMGFV